MKKIITLLFALTIVYSCKDKKKEEAMKVIEGATEVKEVQEPIKIVKQVIAKSGLNFRDKPKGKRIGKLKYNTNVTIVENTGITEEITNNEDIISGEWVGIKHNDKVVYVFDGFLSIPEDDSNYKDNINPIDVAMLQAYIIRPGEYHNYEIPDEMTKDNWFGIFNEDGNYSVEKTPITISEINDKRKKIISEKTENCYLLINNASSIVERKIDTILTKPISIHPTKPYRFQFNNTEYTLSSTAKDYEALNLNINYFKAEGYKLYLEKSEPEKTTKQLLLFEKYFDNQMVQILFIGDIDGDTIPDLLIDSSNHYNKTVPTLYLSKEANEDEIVKVVSLHKSVGS